MSALRVAAIVLALATFAGFIWAVRRFFIAPEVPQPGMRAIALGGTVTMALHLAALLGAPPVMPFVEALGVLFYGASLALFWSAVQANRSQPPTLAFSDDEPEHLVTAGPYRLIRHPFYAAYLAAWVGGLLASGHPLLLPTVVGMGALYVRAARLEEAKFADSRLAAAYAAYKRRAGMFLPRPALLTTMTAPADRGAAQLRQP